jgi:transcriptional regulator with XRE-family HTH domain
MRRKAVKLCDKIRYLREVEGSLRGFGRAMTQGELVRAIAEEMGEPLSQSYLSQIESGSRPHLTNTSRLLLAKFFKVHPGYLVDDPEGYHAELMSDLRGLEDKLDIWLIGGAERFRRDAELRRALLAISKHEDSRGCLLLLESVLETPSLAERLMELLRPQTDAGATTETRVRKSGSPPQRASALAGAPTLVTSTRVGDGSVARKKSQLGGAR